MAVESQLGTEAPLLEQRGRLAPPEPATLVDPRSGTHGLADRGHEGSSAGHRIPWTMKSESAWPILAATSSDRRW
jgi:hypothetical protein